MVPLIREWGVNVKVRTYKDPLTLSLDIANDRTNVVLLWELEKKKQEISDLNKILSAIPADSLMEHLAALVEAGFVSRTVRNQQQPIKVEYILTNRGAKYLKCIRRMMDVGIEVMLDYQMEEVLIEGGYIELCDDEIAA